MTRGSNGTEIKITQPVLVQSLEDEFDLPGGKVFLLRRAVWCRCSRHGGLMFS